MNPKQKAVASVKTIQPLERAIKVWCPSCWMDRIITSNGKCKICGTKLLRPKHWDTTIRKLELIGKNRREYFAVEIKNFLYMVPFEYLDELEMIDRNDHARIGEYIESIKERCRSFKI